MEQHIAKARKGIENVQCRNTNHKINNNTIGDAKGVKKNCGHQRQLKECRRIIKNKGAKGKERNVKGKQSKKTY